MIGLMNEEIVWNHNTSRGVKEGPADRFRPREVTKSCRKDFFKSQNSSLGWLQKCYKPRTGRVEWLIVIEFRDKLQRKPELSPQPPLKIWSRTPF